MTPAHRLVASLARLLPQRKAAVIHCWADGPTSYHYFDSPHEDTGVGRLVYPGIREISYTCLLPDGHEGEHKWTPDGEIGVKFR